MPRLWSQLVAVALATGLGWSAAVQAEAPKTLEVKPGETVVLIGNTLAERMLYFPDFEVLLHARFPEHKLVFRDLGWSADELTLRPRSQDFKDHGHNLEDHKPQVILAAFGFNESFKGEQGLPKFEKDLETFIKTTTSTKYDGQNPPRLVLLTPIANEDQIDRGILAGKLNNDRLALYVAAMKKVAAAHDVQCIDLFEATKSLYGKANADKKFLTTNGSHLSAAGYAALAPVLDEAIFGKAPAYKGDLKKIKTEVAEKNLQFFYDYRAVNGFYIYGGRKNPFGVVNFPAEFKKLRKMIANRDERIWQVAQGKEVPVQIDDSNTGDFTTIESNFKNDVKYPTAAEQQQSFTLTPDFEINCFASEEDFPDLKDPVSFAFDNKGRLWVATCPSYPMYLPGTPVNDKLLIFEDTNNDGKADKQTVFADGLHLPIGFELGDGGAYVSQQPNLMFLPDRDGDDKADSRELVLHGFDSADSHHSISAFEWGPGGEMYFQEGTFHHTQIETPYGPERVANAGVFRYEPKTDKVDIHVSYGFANPWGYCFDKWGEDFCADASGGANYVAAAFSGDVDYPRKHPGLKQFLTKQWRPTCGCQFVSSRHFPDSMQGDYLLNNCIGFQGTLQYRMKDDGSGFAADPVDPLVRCADPYYRPVDLDFAPDGSLYILDWYNPLVGHMQHSIRDPNRDHTHGRIWRVTYKKNPLVVPAKIDGEPIDKLLGLLTTYEDRTRYRVRRELRGRPTKDVTTAVDQLAATLKGDDEATQHHLLELLWVKQHHDVVDEELLGRILKSKEPRARAAGVRVLCYWRDRVKDPLKKLETAVNDEHPRVRMEAVRALSFFNTQEALDIAVQVLLQPTDEYIDYVLKETTATLEGRIKANSQASAK
jgi:glucose/arabinose dehydrogenase